LQRERYTETLTPEHAEELVLLDTFVRHPTPELAVLPLEPREIEAQLTRRK